MQLSTRTIRNDSYIRSIMRITKNVRVSLHQSRRRKLESWSRSAGVLFPARVGTVLGTVQYCTMCKPRPAISPPLPSPPLPSPPLPSPPLPSPLLPTTYYLLPTTYTALYLLYLLPATVPTAYCRLPTVLQLGFRYSYEYGTRTRSRPPLLGRVPPIGLILTNF